MEIQTALAVLPEAGLVGEGGVPRKRRVGRLHVRARRSLRRAGSLRVAGFESAPITISPDQRYHVAPQAGMKALASGPMRSRFRHFAVGSFPRSIASSYQQRKDAAAAARRPVMRPTAGAAGLAGAVMAL